MKSVPRIGVAVIIKRQGRILLGLRKNAHGQGTWALPGGHLEFGEDILACARREVLEETGMTLKNPRLGPCTNDIFEREGKHYVTLFVLAEHGSGEPELLEPHKCAEWRWCGPDRLPRPRFLSLENLLANAPECLA